jgi:hypothetical protein
MSWWCGSPDGVNFSLGGVDLPLHNDAGSPNGGGGSAGRRWRSPLHGYVQWACGVPGLHGGG